MSKMHQLFYSAIIFHSLIMNSNLQKYEGDLCTVESTGTSGQCALIENCPHTKEQLIKHQIYPQLCGFKDVHPIVCCVESAQPIGKLSKEKCKEYGKYVYINEVPPIPLPGAPEYTKDMCGHKVVPLIVGGELAQVREFPHMAIIGYESKTIQWICGGSLISELFVLTAGHCLHHSTYGDAKYVRVGDLKLSTSTEGALPQEFLISKLLRYPDFTRLAKYHDIALIKLNKSAKLNPYVRPACLYTGAEINADKAIATGWGNVDVNAKQSDDLRKVVVEIFADTECSQAYPADRYLKSGIDVDNQICAGSRTDRKDACQGDSGGPLQIYNTDVYCTYYIIGITSFGKGCGTVEFPGVYTKIIKYLKWIEQEVWQQ